MLEVALSSTRRCAKEHILLGITAEAELKTHGMLFTSMLREGRQAWVVTPKGNVFSCVGFRKCSIPSNLSF